LRYIVFRYTITTVAIQSFNCGDTEALHLRRRVARFVNIEAVARRKLAQVDAAATLDFMRVPPGNRLEALKGNRARQHSVRINDQWRLCFIWTAQGPRDVEIVDYH
jgi:proteic killer suppression protein